MTPAVPSVLFLSSRLYFPHDNYSSIDINSSDSTPNSTTGDKIIGSAKDAGKKLIGSVTAFFKRKSLES